MLGAAVLLTGSCAGIGASAAAATPTAGVRCGSAAGAAVLEPKLGPAPQAVAMRLNTFRLSHCRHATSTTATASGTLESASASCPLAPQDRLQGEIQIDWHGGATTYIQTARVVSTNNAADPFEVRLAGRVTGGDRTGATLRAVLHLTPTHGDCARGLGSVAIANVDAVRIGGPYAHCDTAQASATITPGLQQPPAPQNLHFESFQVSGCAASDTATAANVIGALESDNAGCPVGHSERFRGMLEIDWANHFVSILKRAHLNSTHDPDDPYQWILHGVITSGADVGATVQVVLHAEPANGQECNSGVGAITLTNVGALTVT